MDEGDFMMGSKRRKMSGGEFMMGSRGASGEVGSQDLVDRESLVSAFGGGNRRREPPAEEREYEEQPREEEHRRPDRDNPTDMGGIVDAFDVRKRRGRF